MRRTPLPACMPLALLASVLFFSMAFACNKATFTDVEQREAGVILKPGDCVAPPIFRCDAGGPLACDPDLDSGSLSSLDASVLVGCAVQFTSPDPIPHTNECYTSEVCRCISDNGVPRWTCRK
jgi:hypothetical protein